MESSRIRKLREKMAEIKIDSLLVSNFYNILYLTGFKTLTTDEREAFALVTKNNMYLFTDGRYLSKNLQLPFSNFKLELIEPGKSVIMHLADIVDDEKLPSLAVEAEDLHVDEYKKLQKAFPAVNLLPVNNFIIKIREVKDREEIKKIQKACTITDQCLTAIVKTIKIDMTEKEIAFRLEMWLKKHGHDLSFDPIVAVNQNSAIPHYATKAGHGKVKKQSVVLIDFGAKYEDYQSDITRMVLINPSTEMINTYNKLRQLQEETIAQIRIGQPAKKLDEFSRQHHSFAHSLGHGVGLEIHEYPKLSSQSADIIRPGQVFTVEPGIYLPRKYGMRVEDTVTIDATGRVAVLTRFPKVL